MRLFTAIFAAAVLAGPVLAAPASPMEQCTAQWLDLKAAGKTGGQAYRPFLLGCLKNGAALPASVTAGPGKAKSSTKRPSKMGQCAAQWDGMKARDTTHGLTYRQWTSQCMKKK